MARIHLAHACGQRIWLDQLCHCDLTDGTLTRLIQSGLSGITFNPTLFHQAIEADPSYLEVARRFCRAVGICEPRSLLYELVRRDLQPACDLLLPVYEMEGGVDGFVSYEIDPHLAYDAERSIEVARTSYALFERENVMIKIPGTEPGLKAIEELTYQGLHVNVTLLFSPCRYRKVAEAYMRGLERRLEEGKPVDSVVSVASFFLSRIDVLADRWLAERATPEQRARLEGRAAFVQAALAYRTYRELMAGERWRRLARAGASPQRLLWASMGVKRKEDPPLKYAEGLIAPETISTLPLQTLETFLEEAVVTVQIDRHLEGAEALASQFREAGVDLEEVAEALERDGVQRFIDSWDALFGLLKERLAA